MAIPSIVHQANSIFPNLEIELQDAGLQRAIVSRCFGRYAVTRINMPAASVELVGRRASEAGLGGHFKLIWQLAGSMHYSGPDRNFDVGPGQMFISSMAEDYRLDMFGDHQSLVLVFDPADDAKWCELARDALARQIASRPGIVAASGGVNALISAGEAGLSAEFAAHAMIDLALLSTRSSDREDPDPKHPTLARASMHVLRNVGDSGYGPKQLARNMGMSRRSLYQRLGLLGTTPGDLIRQTRLERAREDILHDRHRSLLDIALANGFRDGSSLSRAFQIHYGYPPSHLRRQEFELH